MKIDLQQLSKHYRTKRGSVQALDVVDLSIDAGEFVAIRGPSGCGKTTLLLALGGMLRPTSGTVTVDDTDLYRLSSKERAAFRACRIGFVFQMFHLVPYLSVLENLWLGSGVRANTRPDKKRAAELLDQLGIIDRQHHLPSELSAGEKQRAAVARAMINTPEAILADEPTGNLDPDNEADVVRYLQDFNKQGGTVVMVTHGTAADHAANRIISLENGRML